MREDGARAQQAAKTRKKIQEASLLLFEQYGYDNVSIDQICEACGISKGGFYHHFKSKSELFLQGVSSLEDEYAGFVSTSEGLSLERRICGLLERAAAFTERRGKRYIAEATKYLVVGKNDYSDPRSVIGIFHNSAESIIQQAVDRGELRQGYPMEIATDVMSAYFSGEVINWCFSSEPYSINERVLAGATCIARAVADL
jgi:AcrR family transcriptional regulator